MNSSNLVRFGIKTTIIDERPDKTSTGRADGLQPKTIETFKQLRLADSLLRKGVRIYDICFWVGDEIVQGPSRSADSAIRTLRPHPHCNERSARSIILPMW